MSKETLPAVLPDELDEQESQIIDINEQLNALENTALQLIERLKRLAELALDIESLPQKWRIRVNELRHEAQLLSEHCKAVESTHGVIPNDAYSVTTYVTGDDPTGGRQYLESIKLRDNKNRRAEGLESIIANSYEEVKLRLAPVNAEKKKVLGALLDISQEYDNLNANVLIVIANTTLGNGMETIISWDKKGATEFFEQTGFALNEIRRLHDLLVVD